MKITDVEKFLQALGFTITESFTNDWGTKITEGIMEFDRGTLEVALGNNGTARVIKPNGTVKWLYEKTEGQIRRALLQTMEYYQK